jgi:uncharacterized protein (DUF302 family)
MRSSSLTADLLAFLKGSLIEVAGGQGRDLMVLGSSGERQSIADRSRFISRCREENMTIRKVEFERFSVTSPKPLEMVVAAIKAAVGQPDMAEFAKATKAAQTFAELERTVQKSLGRAGLMIFMELDLGRVLRRETELAVPKIVRLVIGNPLIMKEMVKFVPDAGSYTPVTILVDERPDGTHVSYDRMASLLAPYDNPDALAVARDLDSKIENLLRESAT